MDESEDLGVDDVEAVEQSLSSEEYCERLSVAGLDAYNAGRVDLMADPFTKYMRCHDVDMPYHHQCFNHRHYWGVRSIMTTLGGWGQHASWWSNCDTHTDEQWDAYFTDFYSKF